MTSRHGWSAVPTRSSIRSSSRGRDQVMLKVTVAEVRRDIIKQMGIDLSASMNYGTAVVNFNNTNPFTANGGPLVARQRAWCVVRPHNAVDPTATLRAMESAGVVRTLAEPNLTAISGESATFIVGRRISHSDRCDLSDRSGGRPWGSARRRSAYKKFGISLNFTPVVLTEGQISLRVMTEVSEVSTDKLGGRLSSGISLSLRSRPAAPKPRSKFPPAARWRWPASFRSRPSRPSTACPGLDQIAGARQLFRSQDFVNNQTELMVLVTPYVVRAVAQKDLSRPDDGFAPASDSQSALLGTDQPDLRRAGAGRTGRKLPGQFRLHHRLSRRKRGDGNDDKQKRSVNRYQSACA